MSIDLDAELEAKLNDFARQHGKTPEQVVSETLREKFSAKQENPIVPRDEWERKLLSIGINAGVSPPIDAFSSETYY